MAGKPTMQVLFIDNAGAGFAGEVTVVKDITIAAFFKAKMKNAKTSDHLIRVNRQIVVSTQKLRPGDRVTVTPVKIAGS